MGTRHREGLTKQNRDRVEGKTSVVHPMGERSLAGCAGAGPGFGAALGVVLRRAKPAGGFSVS